MGETTSQLPHIIVHNTKTRNNYTTVVTGNGSLSTPVRNRHAHAQKLISQIEALIPNERRLSEERESLGLKPAGTQVEFLSDPAFNLKLNSLEFQRSGIELCSCRNKQHENQPTTATVFIPDGKIDYFLKKVIAYRDEETTPRTEKSSAKPKNQELVDSISEIKLAVLDSLWTDDQELLPQNQDAPIWWEVWIRLSDKHDNLAYFKENAARLGLRINPKDVKFIDRGVVLAYGSKANMIRSVDLLGVIAELRCAKEVGNFFTGMDQASQWEWVENTLDHVNISPEINTYACLLDTGINHAHPLLECVAAHEDMHSYDLNWGTHDGYRTGHGTPMAGLTVYGDLSDLLQTSLPLEIKHRLESVKILPNSDSNTQNEPELYGAITRESIGRVEIQTDRNRVFCMAVTANDHRGRGLPSSWSATIDSLTSGAEDNTQRLIIISAGNTDPIDYKNYPESNATDNVQDPAQSWNALVVGGYTEKIHITDPELSMYEPLACSGDLAPSSCTSATWDRWPFKPDIVMEAGNIGIDKETGFTTSIDDLKPLSTHHEFQEKLLSSFGETSAATALATHLAAMLLAEYPNFWGETLRGLIVHSAEWTEAMTRRFSPRVKDDYRQLLRFYGYGVPNPAKLFWSTRNSLTLIVQDKLQPFFKDEGDKNRIKTRDINLHTIPWPKDVLEGLEQTTVEMKVTLSYFIEPNPGQRGWSTKYTYASHRLQFDVRRALESENGFKQRINKQARDEEFKATNNASETGEWLLGSNLRKTGSIHSDTWTGTAADLASREQVAVFPLNGWWKELKQHQGWSKKARYSLIISITTPEVENSIYSEVAAQIKTEVVI